MKISEIFNLLDYPFFFYLLVMTTYLTPLTHAADMITAIEISAGYDDNASLSPDAENSGFASCKARLDKRFSPENLAADMDVFLEGNYQNYFSLPDNYRISAGASVTVPMASDRFLPGIISEISTRRDKLEPENDKDGITIGGQMDWLVSARLTLGLRQTWSWLDYGESFSIHKGHHYGQSGNNQGNNQTNSGKQMEYISRDDRIQSSAFQGTFYLSPAVQLNGMIQYDENTSSVETESYEQNRADFSLLWLIGDSWEISPLISWKRTDYDYVSGSIERTDTRWLGELGISYFFKKAEIFVRFEHSDNDSSLDEETYQQTVMQCGMVWYF